MTKVKVLHTDNTRDAPYWEREEVMAGLTNGCFYLAGELEVNADVSFENHDCRADYIQILSLAYQGSQNDAHPNPVIGMESGNPVYGPAEWNGEIAQRSTSVGDLFVVDGQIFRVERHGFRQVVPYGILERHRGIALVDNPWAPGGKYRPTRKINTEFDELLTD